MIFDEFRWPDAFYHDSGLDVRTLEDPSRCDALWAHAVTFAGWPDGLDGRIQFHALVLYCLRVGKPPGRLLTSAVREKKFGRMAWSSARDKVDAAVRIGSANHIQCIRPPRRVERRRIVARDWTEVDAQIALMSDDELLELLTNPFARDLFNRAIDSGKNARQLPLLRTALRDAIGAESRRSAIV